MIPSLQLLSRNDILLIRVKNCSSGLLRKDVYKIYCSSLIMSCCVVNLNGLSTVILPGMSHLITYSALVCPVIFIFWLPEILTI